MYHNYTHPKTCVEFMKKIMAYTCSTKVQSLFSHLQCILRDSTLCKLHAVFFHSFPGHTQSITADISSQMGHYLKIKNMIIPDECSSVNFPLYLSILLPDRYGHAENFFFLFLLYNHKLIYSHSFRIGLRACWEDSILFSGIERVICEFSLS